MLHKKLHIPINLSLDELKDYELNNEIINIIQNLEKYKLSSNVDLFKNYFNNKVSEIIKKGGYYSSFFIFLKNRNFEQFSLQKPS